MPLMDAAPAAHPGQMGPYDEISIEALRLAILVRVRRMLPDARGLDCAIEHDGSRLRVALTGRPIDHWTERALSVQVLEALRTMDCTFGDVEVRYLPLSVPTDTRS